MTRSERSWHRVELQRVDTRNRSCEVIFNAVLLLFGGETPLIGRCFRMSYASTDCQSRDTVVFSVRFQVKRALRLARTVEPDVVVEVPPFRHAGERLGREHDHGAAERVQERYVWLRTVLNGLLSLCLRRSHALDAIRQCNHQIAAHHCRLLRRAHVESTKFMTD